MIRYALTCPEGHDYSSWFASSEAFDKLAQSGHLACEVCGSVPVTKALMAPKVRDGAEGSDREAALAQKLAKMRQAVERNTEDVGKNFATEARAIHAGDAPERAIRGEASGKEAKALIDEGVPIAPLPFIPTSKTN